MACKHTNNCCVLCGRFGRCYVFDFSRMLNSLSVLFLKKYSLKRKIIRTGKKGAEVVPASDVPADLEKGAAQEASAEEVQPSLTA